MQPRNRLRKWVSFERNIPLLLFCMVVFALGVWAMLKDNMFVAITTKKIERKNMALYLMLIALPIPLSQIRLNVSERGGAVFRALYMLLGMFLSALMFTQQTWGVALLGKPWAWAMNMSIAVAIYMGIWLVAWNVKIVVPLANGVLSIAAYLFRMVYSFRGTPVSPEDLLTLDTAANVAGQYTYTYNGSDIIAIVVFFSLIVVGRMVRMPKLRTVKARIAKGVAAALSIGWLVMLCTTTFMQDIGYTVSAWHETYVLHVKQQGQLATFVRDVASVRGTLPDGYNTQAIADAETTLQAYADEAGVDTGFRPNVIAIMNESFTDYTSLLQLETNQDPLPFWHSLSQNTIKGNLYVSVLGGGTCNTEHHFLTSTQYSPLQITSLYSTVRSNTPSLAWQLKALGYQTVAIHPYDASNYSRLKVYPRMGFDTFLDKKAFSGMEKYRVFYSDRACYQKIIEVFENKDEKTPLFVFNVTMQNHGGYNRRNEPTIITLEGEEESKEDKQELLNCMHESDVAFSELIAYFEQQTEPTIILMFGDHQTKMSFEAERQPAKLQVEEELGEYITPFAIWANFPIESKELPMMSDHYLAPLLLQTAGLPLTEYDAYLLDMAEDFPVVTSFGYADSQGNYTAYESEEQPEPRLKEMDIMRYNRLFDNGARLAELAAGVQK